MKPLLAQIKNLLDTEDYETVIAILEEAIEENLDNTELYWYLGLDYLLQGNEAQAQEIWLSVLLRQDAEQVVAITQQLLNFLERQVEGNIKVQKLGNAKIIYEAITALEPDYINEPLAESLVTALYEFGNYLRADKDYTTALDVYKELLSICSDHADSWRAIANCYINLQNYDQAEDAIRKSIELAEMDLVADFQLLGIVLEKKEQYELAIAAFEKVIAIDPKFLDAHALLGALYLHLSDAKNAILVYKKALNFASIGYTISIYENIANAYKALDDKPLESLHIGLAKYVAEKYQYAIPYFKKYLKKFQGSLNTYLQLAFCYIQINETKLAIELCESALNDFPGRLSILVFNQLILPCIYQNSEEVLFYRQRYVQLLDYIVKNIQLFDINELREAYSILPMTTNLYLGYQGYNDVELQKKYNSYIHTIVKKVCPRCFNGLSLKDHGFGNKIRIGFVSTHIHSLGKLYFNWINYCDKNKYEIYIYDISGNDESVNSKSPHLKFRESMKDACNLMKFIPRKIQEIVSSILDDNISILIFAEIGLSAKTGVLSVMRLAPIQCTTWGHPITSGSPNIDYFLASDCLEPNNADKHYSEQLIRLPKLGFSINHPEIPPLTKTRSDFQVYQHSTIYLSCQTPFKYLPKYDHIYPSIAMKHNTAKFIFIDTYPNRNLMNVFKQRLEQSFISFELDFKDYCIFLDLLPYGDYLMLHQLSDVFLDTFDWSGGISSIDAIACGLPIVTCPGEMMRSRQSYGMLKMIGVTETIAESEQHYIDIAVRLGQDHQWRQAVRDKMQANKHELFNDQSCIVALEQFFEDAIAKKLEEEAQQQNSEL